MPTQRALSPHRFLPLILTIPLLLLFAVAGPRYAQGPLALSHATAQARFERHDLPPGWDDDVIKDALPAPPFADDESNRRLRVARVVLECDPATAPPFRLPRREMASFSALDTLAESLLLSRPPPSFPAHT